jgi:glycosyltransferase involved in cell wall biosynthesis
MNICLLTPTFLPKLGGVEIIVSSLARQYVRAGHRVVVVTQWPRKGRGTPQDEVLEYPVVRYPRPFSFFWSFGFRGIRKALDRAHERLPFDILHCHLAYPAGPVALSFARTCGLPVVITTHGSDIRPDSRYRQRRSIWKTICKSLQNADALTAISLDMKNLLTDIVGQNQKEIRVIPNAVDIEEMNLPVRFDPTWPIDPKVPFFLYLGGLSHKKGVDVLLEAIRLLKEKGQGTGKLIIAGDGADRADLEGFSRRHHLEDRVQFVGKVTGPLKYFLFQNCRFVIMPSLTEGFGLVAIEAFCCGKPLIASTVGGLKELMGNDKTLGLPIPPEDPGALAQAIKEMEARLGNFQPQAIREFVRKFDWPNVAQSYLDLYRTVGKKS